jgi:glycosyltransferase involved in cell wall biosynthesis
MLVSVIIISLNEEENIGTTIENAYLAAHTPSGRKIPIEIIISDGGSTDGTLEIVESLVDKVINAPRGRYRQLNLGAEYAKGDILLFLHADTLLPRYGIARIMTRMKDPVVYGGGFKKIWNWTPTVQRSSFLNFAVWFFKGMGNWLVRIFKTFPGDNAIFVRKEIFEKLNGYAPMWICEDFDIMLRLKKFCRKQLIYNEGRELKGQIIYIMSPVKTSARRFELYGFFRTFFQWFFIYWQWRLGMSQDRLKARFNKYSTIPKRGNKHFIMF